MRLRILLLLTGLFLSSTVLLAQRTSLDPALRPFYHGVASGDPLNNGVLLWTRVTPDSFMNQDVTVFWQIATDINFTNPVNYGRIEALPENDYTVKVEVCGLQPNTWYYYNFEAFGQISTTGRTRTAPKGGNDSARFAIVSCSSYENGYFNAYKSIAQRNDVDAVIHLGDYIYEYGTGGYSQGISNRVEDPTNEIISLSDYRIRHSHYKLDNDLKRLHQVVPFMTVWDDHESANDAWKNGAENHNSGEGPWAARLANSTKAYQEWMPLRYPDPTDTVKIYRSIQWGDLLNILMLDTRIIGRDEQDLGAANNSNRSLLGATQYQWLTQQLSDSSFTWKMLAQQVMMAPLRVFGIPVNADQWDGYAYERDQLGNFVTGNNIRNVFVVTGDIHTSWVSDIPGPGYNSSTGANSRMVEFVTTSVTSPGFPIAVGAGVIQALNSHIKYVDLTEHGYMVTSVSKARTQTDFFYVTNIITPNASTYRGASYYTLPNQRNVRSTNTQFVRNISNPALPSATPNQNLPFRKTPSLVRDTMSKNQSVVDFCVVPTPVCPARDLVIIDSANYGICYESNGCIRYAPDSNFIGRDTVIAVTCQTRAPFQCDTITLAIWVQGVTDPSKIDTMIRPGDSLLICWSPDDLPIAPDTTILSIAPNNGSVILQDSCLLFIPDSGYCGYDTFQILACPLVPDGVCDTLDVFILTFPQIPAENWQVTIPFDSGFGLCYTFDDIQPPFSSSGQWQQSSHAVVSTISDSCLTYQSNATSGGADSIYIWACDFSVPRKCDSLKIGITLEEVTTGISGPSLAILGAYPNPFYDEFTVQFNMFFEAEFNIRLIDASGKVITSRKLEAVPAGLNYYRINGLEVLPAGNYILEIESGNRISRNSLIKL